MASLRDATIVAAVLLAYSMIAPPDARPAEAQIIAVTACGQTLGAPGKYQLMNDIGPCPGNGVNITSSNVRFDLGNFTISGNLLACNNGPVLGISVSGPVSSVVISGGTITNFNVGVDLSFVTDSSMKGVVVGITCSGVSVAQSQKIKITGNLISSASLDGVDIFGSSDHITVNGNSILSNARFGVLIQSPQNKITGNKINSNGGGGQGVGVVDLGERNKIKGNTISGNEDTGVRLTGHHSVVRNNTVDGNTLFGIAVEFLGASQNKITSNTATGNGVADLVDVNPACDSDTWFGNSFATDLVAGLPDGGPGTGCIQ